MARIPEPVPISSRDNFGFRVFKWDDDFRNLSTQATICSRQKLVVGCCPVPKLKPGSRTTTDCFFVARYLLHEGLMSSESPISIGWKWRFHDSAQFSRRTF